MSKTIDDFIAILKGAMNEEKEEINLNDVDFEALFSLSKFHDMAHIVCYELKRRGALPDNETGKRFTKQYDMAILRHIRRTAAISQLRDLLEKERIPFILLKGAVMMDLYPQQWMRTSADVDILVKEEDVIKVSDILIAAEMTREQECSHHVSFVSKNNMHIEVHYCLIEDFYLAESSEAFKDIWDHVELKKESVSEYVMRDEWFYLYHIAHMAKHFKTGGCGVRSVLDIWMLDHKVRYDGKKRDNLIGKCKLTSFETAVKELSEIWFSGKENNAAAEELENYIINGGIYGTPEHGIIIRKQSENNRFIYYLKRIFMPYRYIKHEYPVLKKCPFLLPFCWAARWFRLIDPKKRRAALNEIKIESSADNEESKRIETLIKKLEI